VELQAQADIEVVSKDPFGERPRVQLTENGRKDDLIDKGTKVVPIEEIARITIIGLIEDHELDLVLALQRLQISETKLVTFSAPRALDVDYLHDRSRQVPHKTLAAGLDEDAIALPKELFRERIDLLLEQGLAPGNFHELPSHPPNAAEDLLHRHFRPAVKSVGGVAPVAAQIAARQPDE
jgi:hypothetical protein